MNTYPSNRSRRFWRRFVSLFLVGLIGIATLPFFLVRFLPSLDLPPSAPSLPLLVVLSLIQPTLLLAGAVALGTALAPRLQLRSHIAERAESGTPIWNSLRDEMWIAVGLGVLVGVVIMLLDTVVFKPQLESFFAKAEEIQPRGIGATLTGLFFGGLTEELLMRWGLLSLFAWGFWRLFQRNQNAPNLWVMWSAIISVALVFGLGHLPAAAAIEPLTAPLVIRTISLNGFAALFFGWLFWRRSLEAAMISHATVHVVFSIVVWFGFS